MFGKAYKLPFRLVGIPVLIDITFLIVLPLFTWIIGAGIKSEHEILGLNSDAQALRQGIMPYVIGFVAVIGLFVSVVIHELGHALVARGYGVQTRSITLWLLGGVAQLDTIPRQRGAEAVIAIVGPIVSAALAMLCWGIALVVPQGMHATHFLMKYLALMNLVLAIFNLLPALPLDGGRVLRSLLALRLDYFRATQAAGAISRVLAIALGLFGFLTGDLMLMLVAFFVFMAVSSETQMAVMEQMLSGIKVQDLMNHDVITVSPHTSASELTQLMIRERHKGFPVVDEQGQLLGMVDLDGLHGIGPDTPVAQFMAPQVMTIHADAQASDAMSQMSENNFGRLIVLDPATGNMVGIITKHDLIRAIQIRLAAMQSRSPAWQQRRIAHA